MNPPSGAGPSQVHFKSTPATALTGPLPTDEEIAQLHSKVIAEWKAKLASTAQKELQDNSSSLSAALAHEEAIAASFPKASCEIMRAQVWPAGSSRPGTWPVDPSLATVNPALRPACDVPLALASTPMANSTTGGHVWVRPHVVPTNAPAPPYKAWYHVQRNVISRELGQPMFYTDDTGETVPASDDEDEEDLDYADGQKLDGITQDQVNQLIMEVVTKYGEDLNVIQVLTEHLGVSIFALRERISELFWIERGCPRLKWEEKEGGLATLDNDFLDAWCRLCRTYGCVMHEGRPHARPVQGPIKERSRGKGTDKQSVLCSAHCYKATLQQPQQRQQQRQQPVEDDPMEVDDQHQEHGGQPSTNPALAAVFGGSDMDTFKKKKSPPVGSGNVASSNPAVSSVAAALVDVPARRRPSSSGSPPLPPDGVGAPQQPDEPEMPSGWNTWEQTSFDLGLEMWGRQPCKIAVLIGSKTCTEVYQCIEMLGDALPDDNETDAARKKRRKGKQKRSAPSVAYERHRHATVHKQDIWPQFNPCNCIGPCRDTCSCRGDVNFCEKFCACDPEKCGNRFSGCNCKCGVTMGKRCSTRQCPCMAAGRECDPDLCKDCRPTLNGSHRTGWVCNNFRVRLSQKKRILMGLSDVQGWGAFTQHAVQKEGFLGEYLGELIDHEEADRRGRAYDRDDNSYLFNLNMDWVIDARHKGNKLRFANHSSQANCRAEIIMLDGNHRVAILASRDIEAGDELFYDYNYDKRVAPGWAHKPDAPDNAGGKKADKDKAAPRGRGRGRGRGKK